MTELRLSVGEPFTSPAWGSNFVMFSSEEIIPEETTKDYLRRVCKYARSYQVYLVPQRFVLQDCQCLCLISPEGKVLGAQKALFLHGKNPVGTRSNDLDVIRTEFGGISLCVDVDVYRPEVSRIAQSMGAQFLLCSQHIAPEDYTSSMVLTGGWNAAQSCVLFVVSVSSQFHCVCAPLELTRHQDGFIVQPSQKLPMTAKLSADALLRCKQPFHLSRRLYAIHREDLIR